MKTCDNTNCTTKPMRGFNLCNEHAGCLDLKCQEPYHSNGYCLKHYYKALSFGNLQKKNNKICKYKGCVRSHYAKDCCRKHYARYVENKHRQHQGNTCKTERCQRSILMGKDYCHSCQKIVGKGLDPNIKNHGVKGENNYKWNGGVAAYKNHYTMKKARLKKLELVGSKCEDCGVEKPSNKLEVHHLDKSKDNHSLDNLRLLCHKCHIGNYHKGEVGRKKHLINGMTYNEIAKRAGCTYKIVYLYIKSNCKRRSPYRDAINLLIDGEKS